MDPCIGGTLFYFLSHSARGDLNSDVIRFYMAEIIIALEKIHSKNVMYRDLKPENILIDVDGHIKITDFGLSKQIKRRDETSLTFCGSPEYIPPEMLFGLEHSRLVDFYTLGCLFYELMIGFPPFHCENKRNLYKRIMAGILKFPKNIDPEAQDLMEWLLSKKPENRPKDFNEIKQHPFFVNIHWGRIAQKEAIPPWIPDLYSCHIPKRFTQIPLKQAFYCNPYLKELNSKSYDQVDKGNVSSLKGILVKDKNSNRQKIKITDKIDDSFAKSLYLEEPLKLYESVIQCVQTLKTKCTDNYLETDEDLKIDENCEQIQEGTINNLNKYNCADSFHFKIPKIIRSTTERMPKTPKHEAHLQFYKETFENFNDAFTTPHVLKHKTININAERNRNLD